MAYITVKSGIVGRNLKDKGFELLEKFEVNGSPVTKRYAVWCLPELIPAEGTEIDVTGILSVNVSERDGKSYANISINKPRFDNAAYRQKSVQQVAQEFDNSPF